MKLQSKESLLGCVLREEQAKLRETLAWKGLGLEFCILGSGPALRVSTDLHHLIKRCRLYNPLLSAHALTHNAHRKTHSGVKTTMLIYCNYVIVRLRLNQG